MENSSPEISVVLPAHNEEEAIAEVIAGVKKALDGRSFEILVVDDGSEDGTAEAARKAGARVVSHAYRKGNGAAIKKGIRESRGRLLVLMDADGQHPPEFLPQLVQPLERFDMVIGCRTGSGQQRWHRRMANWVFSFLASYLVGEKIVDLTSGFRALPRELALRYVELLPNTFSYPSTLTMVLSRSGYTLGQVPIDFRPPASRSKIKPLRDGLRFLFILIKIGVGFAPGRVFIPLSLALFFLGCGWYLHTYLESRRFTNMSLLLFCTAVIIFMLGLVAEQIAALRRERREK